MNNGATSPFIDTSLETVAFQRGLKYVSKLISPKNIEAITAEELTYILTNKRTKQNEPLASNSIAYILSIIKQKNPAIKLTKKDLPQYSKSQTLNLLEENIITKAIFKSIKYLKQISTETNYIQHRIWYNTGIAVLLATSVCLRSSELVQLTFRNYLQILNRQPVPIRVKKRAKSPILLGNQFLLQTYLPYVKKIVEYEQNISSGNNKLISVSVVTFNKCFKSTVESIAKDENVKAITTFGMQSIRRVTATIILRETGDATLAQRFMRHDNNETTIKYYNTGNYVPDKLQKLYSNFQIS